MAKVKRKNFQKYSFNDRSKYHGSRARKFVDKFRVKTKDGSNIDFEKLEKAEKRNSSFSYSMGYSSGSNDILRNFTEKDFSKETSSFKKGYQKAQNDYKKALNQKI